MRTFYLTVAAIAMLVASSCQSDGLDSGSVSGEEVMVSISASMPEGAGAAVKSAAEPGDGSDVNRCIMSVYLADGQEDPVPYGDKLTVAVTGGTAQFPDLMLISGHNYRFVFWADHVEDNTSEAGRAADLHYDTGAFPIVSFKEGDVYMSNDDTRDAFCLVKDVEITGPGTQNFELIRPFGQLNVITTDWGLIPESLAGTLRPAQVRLSFTEVPTQMDILDGTLGGNAEVAGTAVGVSEVAQDGNSKHLSFDYIFAGADEQTVLGAFTMDFLLSDGVTEVTDSYEFSGIPVQRNYQTNVSGNLFTDRTGISVEVVPEFNEPAITVVQTEEQLVDILTNGGEARLAGDMTLSSQNLTLTEGAEASLDLGGHTVTFDATFNAVNSSLTLSNGNVEAMSISSVTQTNIAVGDGGSITLDKITMKTSGAGVGILENIKEGKLTVTNSVIECETYPVATNASLPVSENVTIVLENSTFIGSDPVFVNIPAQVTVTGCEMTGTTHGMILRGGTAEVADSRITLHYTDNDGDTIGSYFDTINWGTGNMMNIAGLTVGNKLPGNSYQYPSSLVLKNTVVEVTGPYADKLPAMYVWANEGEGLGVEIIYDENTKFYGARTYGNGGKNITVNGGAPVSDSGDVRP